MEYKFGYMKLNQQKDKLQLQLENKNRFFYTILKSKYILMLIHNGMVPKIAKEKLNWKSLIKMMMRS